MKVKLSAPSKTFLIGEYAVLEGGPCLVAATEPRFTLLVDSFARGQCQGIDPSSPAGRWIRSHVEDFSSVSVQFVDPHLGKGGFGASSAQFLLCNVWSALQRRGFAEVARELSPGEVRRSFLAQHNPADGRAPSGADVAAQMVGGVCRFMAEPFMTVPCQWAFRDLGFLLIRTGKKLATHEHLKSSLPKVSAQLLQTSKQGVGAFQDSDSAGFVSAVNQFGEELQRLSLVAPETERQLGEVKSLKGALAAKGCGAMGADVILLLSRPSDQLSLRTTLKSLNYEVVADQTILSEGIKIEADLEPRQQPRLDTMIAGLGSPWGASDGQ